MVSTVFLTCACGLCGIAAGGASIFVMSNLALDPARKTPASRSPKMTALRRHMMEQSGVFAAMVAILPTVTPVVRRLPLAGMKLSLAENHRRAGYPGGLLSDELFAYGLLIGAVFAMLTAALLAVVLGGPWVLLSLLSLPVGPAILSSSYTSMATERRHKIRRMLPYVFDLLVMALRSGSSLLQAMQRVADDFAGTPIGEEFDQALTELKLGTTRRLVFQEMAQRVDLPDMTQFVDNLLQAEELGRPLADTIDQLATRFRYQRVQAAETKAGTAGVIVMIPSTLIFIANLLVLVGPFLLKILLGGISF